METTFAQPSTSTPSKGILWTGRIISGICILFLLFDAAMKIIRERHTIEASARIGWPAGAIQPTGIVLLLCTILYILPRTATLGAILLTAYLGGATAIMVQSGGSFIFSVIFGILVWLGLYLRDAGLHAHVPLRKP